VLVVLAVRLVLLLPVQMALTLFFVLLLLQVVAAARHILALVVTQEAAVVVEAHLDTQVAVQDRVALELRVKEITAAQDFLQQINPLAVAAVLGL
jgi:hypothetical protein